MESCPSPYCGSASRTRSIVTTSVNILLRDARRSTTSTKECCPSACSGCTSRTWSSRHCHECEYPSTWRAQILSPRRQRQQQKSAILLHTADALLGRGRLVIVMSVNILYVTCVGTFASTTTTMKECCPLPYCGCISGTWTVPYYGCITQNGLLVIVISVRFACDWTKTALGISRT